MTSQRSSRSYAVQPARVPYPGLRSFHRDETNLFFGRDDCIDLLVGRLAKTRFLAVLGSSGTGKSSLAKTGLLSALQMGLMYEAGSRWRFVEFEPGAAPIRNLAEQLLKTASSDIEAPPTGVNVIDPVDQLANMLHRGPRSLIEWCRNGNLAPDCNLLLLVDQFEELFRYQDYAGQEQAEAFVELLLESGPRARERDKAIAERMANDEHREGADAHDARLTERSSSSREPRIYVVLTMRSEYLAACALIEGLAEAVNEGMYLTPRMTREQCREAVVGPARVCGGKVDPPLVNRLLNDLSSFAPWDESTKEDQLDRIARRADQLPLLQYTLNRMWVRARETRGGGRLTLDLDDYKTVGGLQGAIDSHANEILNRLGPERRPVVEKVFRALIDGSSVAEAVRRHPTFGQLVAICDHDEAAVREVVDTFRAPDCNFLVPEADQPLTADTIVEISHESLIRQWKALSDWLREEAEAGRSWQRLTDAAEGYRGRKGGLLEGRSLNSLLEFRDSTNPNPAWTARYGGDHADTLAFLAESENAARRKRFWRGAMGAVGVVLLVAIVAIAVLLISMQKENENLQLARNELDRNIKQTVQSALSMFASKARSHQVKAEAAKTGKERENEWHGSWNLLAHYLSKVSPILQRNPHFVDEDAAQTLHWRVLEQLARAERPIVKVMELEDKAVDELATPAGLRFGLLATQSGRDRHLYLFDKLTAAIVARSDELDSVVGRDGSVREKQTHFVSPDGKNAVVIFDRREETSIIHWSLSDPNNKPREVSFDLGSASGEFLRRADILSMAFDQESARVALVLKSSDGVSRIVFSKPSDGPSENSVLLPDLTSLVSVSNFLDPKRSEACGKRWLEPEEDLFRADLQSFVGGRLVVRLAHKRRPDGFVAIDPKNGSPQKLLVLPNLGRSSTPDERAVFTIAPWNPDYDCNVVDGDLNMPPASPAYSPGAYLIALDAAIGRATLIASIPAASEIVRISAPPPGSPGPFRYAILLRAAGAYRAINVESGEGGSYRVLDDAPPSMSPFSIARPDRSPEQAAWPLPIDESHLIIGKHDETHDRMVALLNKNRSRVTIFAYGDDKAVVSQLRSGLGIRGPPRHLELGSTEAVQGAFGDRQFLLLVGNRAKKRTTQDENQAPETALHAAIVNLNTTGSRTSDELIWNAAEITPSCLSSPPRRFAFRDIRYWGREGPAAKEGSSAGRSVFIGLDKNRLTKVMVDPALRPAQVSIECIEPSFTGTPNFLAIDSSQGHAVIGDDNSIYVYSLHAAVPRIIELDAMPTTTGLAEPSKLMPAAAVFVEPSKLMLASANGDIYLAEQSVVNAADKRTVDGSGNARKAKLLLKGVVSSVSQVRADGGYLLVIADNGYAIVLKFDGNSLHPAWIGNLPAPGQDDTYDVAFDAGDRIVDVAQRGTMDRYRLSPLPAEAELRGLIESRGHLPEKSDVQLGDLVVTLMGIGDYTTQDSQTMGPLDTAATCELAADAALSALEPSFLGAPPERTRNLDKLMRQCSDPKTDQRSSTVASTAHVILNMLAVDPARTVSGWPREWSMLLRAAARGDQLALKALIFALKSSDKEIIKNQARTIWNGLVGSRIIVSRDALELFGAGAAIPDDVTRREASPANAVAPTTQLLFGYFSERQGNDDDALARALFHFWIAEERFRVSGRSEEEERARARRVMLSRALPDEQVRAVRARLAAWHGGYVTPGGENLPSDDATRLSLAVADLDRVAERFGKPEALVLLKSILLWSLGEMQEISDPVQARQSYNTALAVLEGISDAPTDFASLFTSWSRKYEKLGDYSLAVRASTRALMLFEAMDSIASSKDLAQYKSAISTLRALLEKNPLIADVQKTLKFNRNLVHYSSLGRYQPTQRKLIREVLSEKLALLETADQLNWVEQRGLTAFWLGVIAEYDQMENRDQSAKADFRSQAKRYLDAAIKDLETAAAIDASNLDLNYFRAEALFWRGRVSCDSVFCNTQMAGRERMQFALEAKQSYARVIDSFERDRWELPPWSDAADLYSSYAETLDILARQSYQFLGNARDEWVPWESDVIDLIWGSLRNTRLWESIREQADNAPGNTWGNNVSWGLNYTVGLLAGRLRLEHFKQHQNEIHDCDRLISAALDPLRRANSVPRGEVDLENAGKECRAALEWSEDGHYEFLLGRALEGTSEDTIDQKAIPYHTRAANKGYAQIFNTVAYFVGNLPAYVNEDRDERLHRLYKDLANGYEQRLLLSSFAIVYEFLKGRVRDEEDRETLRWLAKRAARIGIPEAQVALADDFPGTDAEKWFHLQLAAQLVDEGKTGAPHIDAAAIRARADQIRLSAEERERVQQDVRSWRREPLFEIPPETWQLLAPTLH
jgi:tetratricopeptide (TPR) repeat protein